MEKKIQVNAIGDTCPIPVVKAKNAIKELQGSGEVAILVDNEIAVQNLTKMANQKGYSVKAEKLKEQCYQVTLSLEGANDVRTEGTTVIETTCVCTGAKAENIAIAIASSKMGEGDETAGNRLMKSFLYSLSQQDELPSVILFYNSGAILTCEGSGVLEELKTLEAQGVELLTCGTCLDFYKVADKFCVGSATDMYTLTGKMMQADLVIRP